jgi:hypothetical protein
MYSKKIMFFTNLLIVFAKPASLLHSVVVIDNFKSIVILKFRVYKLQYKASYVY